MGAQLVFVKQYHIWRSGVIVTESTLFVALTWSIDDDHDRNSNKVQFVVVNAVLKVLWDYEVLWTGLLGKRSILELRRSTTRSWKKMSHWASQTYIQLQIQAQVDVSNGRNNSIQWFVDDLFACMFQD